MAKTTKARRIYDATMKDIEALAHIGGLYKSMDFLRSLDAMGNVTTEGERDVWIYRRTLNEMYAQLERDKRHLRTEFRICGMSDYLALRVNMVRIMENTLKNVERLYFES